MTAPLPPHDLGAEAAVLSAVLLEPERLGELDGLGAEAFFDTKHRHIWQAIIGCAEAGTPIDAITVAAWLKDRGRLLDAGGVPYLGTVVDEVPVVHNVAAYGALVVGHWRRRKAVAELEALSARIKTGAAGLEEVGAAATRLEQLDTGKATPVRGAADIFAPLRAIPWLCKGLAIGPGRPTILSGYGGIGKTFAAQALALAIAAGMRRLWDCFDLQHEGGAVLHLDYEQGQWITDWRYQRLAHSMGIGAEHLEGRLSTIHYPDFYLTSPDAERRLVRLCTGRSLLLIDSLRAACPGVDENDSAMGSYLYLLARVSEKTGCVVVVIHHEGKSSGDTPRQGIERLRGSSAIAAGAGSVVSFVKADSGCIRIEHTRANLGEASDAQLVRLVDEGDISPVTGKTEGIRIEWIPPEQLRQEAAQESDEQHEAALRELCDRMLLCVRRNQDTAEGVTGVGQLARLLRVRDEQARAAFASLRDAGKVISNGRAGRAARWRVAQDGPSNDAHEAAQ